MHTPQARFHLRTTITAAARVVIPVAVLIIPALSGAPSTARAQDTDVLIFSAEPGGGALMAAEFDFVEKIQVRDRLGFCPGGQCFYSSTDPGFRTPSGSRPAEELHALAPGTPVGFEIVAIDAGVSIKWGATVLDAIGESTRIGNALTLHEHPEYQLQAAAGVVGDFALSFRLTTSSQQYAASQVFTLTLTNSDTSATPTGAPATATPSPTPQPTDPPAATATDTETPPATPTVPRTPTFTVPPNETCDGDCGDDGVVSISDLIRGVNIALGRAPLDDCRAFDINDDGAVSVGELISAVRDALDGC
jgi:hypothetical protein